MRGVVACSQDFILVISSKVVDLDPAVQPHDDGSDDVGQSSENEVQAKMEAKGCCGKGEVSVVCQDPGLIWS